MFVRIIVMFVLCFMALGSVSALAAETIDEPIVIAEADNPFADFDTAFDDFHSPGDKESVKLISDPLEPVNRGVFWVNDKLYFYVFKPIAKGFRLVLPRPARVSVKNFFSNLTTPIRLGNTLVQFKFRDFGTELYRFVINSTFGVLGLFDPAESVAGVKKVSEDFGQTLGFYGFGHGFYLVLPVVGPTSLRDVSGSFVDSFADPLRYADLETLEYIGVRWFDVENRLSLDHDTYEGIVQDSLDPYLFMRSAYAQRRLAQVGKGSYNLNIFQSPLFDSDMLNPFEWFGFE